MCINAWLYIRVHGHACIHTYICIAARQVSLHGLCIINWMIELVMLFSPVSLQSYTMFQNRKLRRVMELRRRAQVVQIQMEQVLTGLSWIVQLPDIVMTNSVRTVDTSRWEKEKASRSNQSLGPAACLRAHSVCAHCLGGCKDLSEGQGGCRAPDNMASPDSFSRLTSDESRAPSKWLCSDCLANWQLLTCSFQWSINHSIQDALPATFGTNLDEKNKGLWTELSKCVWLHHFTV